MIKYGKGSQSHISELHASLQALLYKYADLAAAHGWAPLDLTIIEGFRGEAEQNAAYAAGNSKKRWPESGHNKTPARAFDFKPYPFKGWSDRESFVMIQGALRLVATMLNIRLKPLIYWDIGHVELADD